MQIEIANAVVEHLNSATVKSGTPEAYTAKRFNQPFNELEAARGLKVCVLLGPQTDSQEGRHDYETDHEIIVAASKKLVGDPAGMLAKEDAMIRFAQHMKHELIKQPIMADGRLQLQGVATPPFIPEELEVNQRFMVVLTLTYKTITEF